MELDLPFIQAIFNVTAVTAIPSLALNCYLLRRDKEKLVTAILNSPLELDPHHPEIPEAAPSKPSLRSATMLKMPAVPPSQDTKTDPDIRRFVTQRSQNWTAPSKSQWKASRQAATLQPQTL
jgi:hypothetical protein